MQEIQDTWVGSLGQEDPLGGGNATHFSILAWKISWTEGPGGGATVHGIANSQTQLSYAAHTTKIYIKFQLQT